jgi:hypothetical protein
LDLRLCVGHRAVTIILRRRRWELML